MLRFVRVGLGHPKYWQLSDKHPFHNAGMWHDISYDVANITLGKYQLSHLMIALIRYHKEEFVHHYIALLKNEHQLFVNSGQTVNEYLELQDKIFYKSCLQVAGSSWWLKLQAHLFYGIITVYRKLVI